MSVRADPGADRCRHGCDQLVRRVSSGGTPGLTFLLNLDTVPARTRGALALIGDTAYTLADGVTRLKQMFGCSEADAFALVVNDYTWHFPHIVTCRAHGRR